MNLQLYIGSDKVEFFDYESITLKRLIKDLKDPSKVFTEHTKSFTIPASKTNNRVFKHYYRSDVVGGFDARSMQEATLYIDMYKLAKGNVEVSSVDMREGKPYSYNIVFYGGLTELNKRMGQDRLNVLDFSEYNHNNEANQLDSRLTDVDFEFGNNLIYTLNSKTRRFIYDAQTSTTAASMENTTNVGFSSTTRSTNYGVAKSDLTPALRMGEVIQKIQNEYDLEFTGAIKEASVSDLYIALQGKKFDERTSKLATGFPANGYSNGTSFDIGANIVGGSLARTFYVFEVTPVTTSTDFTVTIQGEEGALGSGNTSGETFSYTFDNRTKFNIIVEGASADSIQINIELKSWQEFYYNNETQYGYLGTPETPNSLFTGSATVQVSEEFIVAENMPDLSIKDLLTSLFKMFNIVAEADGNTVTTYFYNHYMSRGSVKDINNYVNRENSKISRVNDFGSVSFEHRDNDTIIEQGYESVNNRRYGTLNYQATDDNGNKFIGDKYDIDTKFSIIPLEQPDHYTTGAPSGVVYSLLSDGKGKERKLKPYLFYRDIIDTSIAYDNGSTIQELTSVLVPSNVLKVSNYAFNGLYFGEEVNELTGQVSYKGSGLFNMFYEGLITQLFSENKRKWTGTADIPMSVLAQIGLNDILTFSGKQYVIESMSTNYNTKLTKLSLITIDGDILDYFKVNCRTYNNSSSESINLVYMNSDGQIASEQIEPNESSYICHIGELFSGNNENLSEFDLENELDEGFYAQLNARVTGAGASSTLIEYEPAFRVNGLLTGDTFSITARLRPLNGYELTDVNVQSYTFSGTIEDLSVTDTFEFIVGGFTQVAAPINVTSTLTYYTQSIPITSKVLDNSSELEPVGVELNLLGTALAGRAPYVYSWSTKLTSESTYVSTGTDSDTLNITVADESRDYKLLITDAQGDTTTKIGTIVGDPIDDGDIYSNLYQVEVPEFGGRVPFTIFANGVVTVERTAGIVAHGNLSVEDESGNTIATYNTSGSINVEGSKTVYMTAPAIDFSNLILYATNYVSSAFTFTLQTNGSSISVRALQVRNATLDIKRFNPTNSLDSSINLDFPAEFGSQAQDVLIKGYTNGSDYYYDIESYSAAWLTFETTENMNTYQSQNMTLAANNTGATRTVDVTFTLQRNDADFYDQFGELVQVTKTITQGTSQSISLNSDYYKIRLRSNGDGASPRVGQASAFGIDEWAGYTIEDYIDVTSDPTTETTTHVVSDWWGQFSNNAPDWITVTKTSLGSGVFRYTADAPDNTTGTTRIAYINITADSDNEVVKILEIVQDAAYMSVAENFADAYDEAETTTTTTAGTNPTTTASTTTTSTTTAATTTSGTTTTTAATTTTTTQANTYYYWTLTGGLEARYDTSFGGAGTEVTLSDGTSGTILSVDTTISYGYYLNLPTITGLYTTTTTTQGTASTTTVVNYDTFTLLNDTTNNAMVVQYDSNYAIGDFIKLVNIPAAGSGCWEIISQGTSTEQPSDTIYGFCSTTTTTAATTTTTTLPVSLTQVWGSTSSYGTSSGACGANSFTNDYWHNGAEEAAFDGDRLYTNSSGTVAASIGWYQLEDENEDAYAAYVSDSAGTISSYYYC